MSSETLAPRGRVLRGRAAANIPGVALDADLSLLQPLQPAAQPNPAEDDAARAIREEASRVGYGDGYAAGREQGIEEARAQVRALAAAAASAVTAVEAAAAELGAREAAAIADVERTVADLALQIAETILGRELQTCDSAARDAVIRALRLAPARREAIARLHPDDVATVGDLTEVAADRAVTVVADAAVERGGCVLDVGPCRIDAQITPALARVREELGA